MEFKHLMLQSILLSSFAFLPLSAEISDNLISRGGEFRGGEGFGGQEFHGGGQFPQDHPGAAGAMGEQHRINKDLDNLPVGGWGGYGGNTYYLPPPTDTGQGGPGMVDDSDQIWQSYQKGN